MSDLRDFYEKINNCAKEGRLFSEIQDESITYRDFITLVRKNLSYFNSENLKVGDKLIIVTKHDKLTISLFVSCLLAGICPIILSADAPLEKLKYFSQATKAQLIFIDQNRLGPNTQERSDWWPSKIVNIKSIQKNQVAFINKLLGKTIALSDTYPGVLDSCDEIEPLDSIESNTLAFIAFTSGSTSNPKGVMLTQHNLFSHFRTLQNVFNYTKDSIIFNNLPLHHLDGLVQGPLIALFSAATLIRPVNFNVQNIDMLLNNMAGKKVSHFVIVPTILSLIDQYTVYNDYFKTPYFKIIISTADKLQTSLWSKFQERFSVKICNVYGLSETVAGGLFCGPDPLNFKHGTIGKPVDMNIKIVDESGKEGNIDEIGELLLQGDNVSVGYFENTTDTEFSFKESWFYTGDLARIDSEGFVEIVGRKKEVIKFGGTAIFPQEIVEALRQFHLVIDASVVGLEDETWGEIPVAILEAKEIVKDDVLFQFYSQHLENEKMPKHFIFIDKIPRGPSGKPLLSELKSIAKNHLLESNKAVYSSINMDEFITISSKILQISPGVLVHEFETGSISSWDSLKHLRLIQAVEKAYNIRFSAADIMRINSLRDLHNSAGVLLENVSA